jgi:hypothetical protein
MGQFFCRDAFLPKESGWQLVEADDEEQAVSEFMKLPSAPKPPTQVVVRLAGSGVIFSVSLHVMRNKEPF